MLVCYSDQKMNILKMLEEEDEERLETIKITQVVEVSSPCPLLARAPCTPVHLLYPALVQENHAAVQTVFCIELPCSALQFTIVENAVFSGGEFCSGAPAKWSCCLLKITQLRRRESWKSRPGGEMLKSRQPVVWNVSLTILSR